MTDLDALYLIDPWVQNQSVVTALTKSANELIPALAEIIRSGSWWEFIHPMQGLKQYATFAEYCEDFLGLNAEAVLQLIPYCDDKRAARAVDSMLTVDVPTDDVNEAVDILMDYFTPDELAAATDAWRTP